MPAEKINLDIIDKIVAEKGKGRAAITPILQAIQSHYRYLPKEALTRVCELADITPAQIVGVATFYTQFRHTPVGKHIIQVCHGTACHMKGAPQVTDAIRRFLKIEGEADTDADRLFTVEKVACFGCCTLAPVVKIDEVFYGHMTQQDIREMISNFLTIQESGEKKVPADTLQPPVLEDRMEIRVGLGSCCIAGGSQNVKDALDAAILRLGAGAVTKRVGCLGVCHRTPLVEFVDRQGTQGIYGNVKPEATANLTTTDTCRTRKQCSSRSPIAYLLSLAILV